MKEKLENLPLFNGRNRKQNYDYDFSLSPDALNREVVFSINRDTIEKIKLICKNQNLEASKLVEALLNEFITNEN